MKPLRIYVLDVLVGGFVGEIFSRNLVRYFNLPGATIIFVAILILGFVLGTGISFIGVLRRLVSGMAKLIDKISTMKMVRREQTERAKKLVKRKQEKGEVKGEIKGEAREETREAPPVVVVDRATPSKKREEIIEQEAFEFAGPRKEFQLPPISLLEAETEKRHKIDRDSLVMNSRILEKKLQDYGVEGRVVEVRPGPVITVYEFEPAPGVKVSRIVNLAYELALALSSVTIGIFAPIPGKSWSESKSPMRSGKRFTSGRSSIPIRSGTRNRSSPLESEKIFQENPSSLIWPKCPISW